MLTTYIHPKRVRSQLEQMVMSKFKAHLKSAQKLQRELNGEEDDDMDLGVDA
jgi:hypothetical protein